MQVQAQISDAWKNEIEGIFQHVNRTPVTTGLLTDYGIYFTNIDKFNGIPSDTSGNIYFYTYKYLTTTS